MDTQEQFTFLLSDKKRKFHIDICADIQKLAATVSRDISSLRVTVLPQPSDTDEYCTFAKATVSVTWKTIDGGEQKASFSYCHEFANENPCERRMRLDAYLPLLEDSCDNYEGIITVSLKEMPNGSALSRSSVYPISSGVLNVEDQLFSISKELFSVHSEFFTVLFNRSFKEKDMECIRHVSTLDAVGKRAESSSKSTFTCVVLSILAVFSFSEGRRIVATIDSASFPTASGAVMQLIRSGKAPCRWTFGRTLWFFPSVPSVEPSEMNYRKSKNGLLVLQNNKDSGHWYTHLTTRPSKEESTWVIGDIIEGSDIFSMHWLYSAKII